MDRLFVLDMPALMNFEADGKIIEYICDHFAKGRCDKVERTENLHDYGATKVINNIEYKVIPLSSVEHTREWLMRVHHVEMTPIEIPLELQKYNPGYQVMQGADLIYANPPGYKYFIKRIDEFKSWNSNQHPYEDDLTPYIKEDGVYVVSPKHTIYSEWRLFVYYDIIQCSNYSGNPMMFPDLNIIERIRYDYLKIPHPRAYTIDIAVTDIGTILLEIHPFIACGLYGFQDEDLLDMWEAGIDWYIKR